MKLLIGGSPSKIFHLEELANALTKLNVETKVVIDNEISDGFPSRKVFRWFNTNTRFKKLIENFKPDFILVDRQRHFAMDAVNSNVKVIIHLRGDYWSEIKWAKETLYKSFPKNIAIKKWEHMSEETFEKADAIVPICKYLEKKSKEKIPNKKLFVMYQGIDSSKWYPTKGQKLNHPCVGILQGAVIWGKAKEMLTLKKVLQEMPNVTFYWAGDGPYRDKILSELGKFENFKWLGSLEYPDKVRDFLSEIDVYALVSGIDMSPLTLLEAQLMRKPVIATNVGGIPELMIDKKTGFLVSKGNPDEIIEKITMLLEDKQKRTDFGNEGRFFVETNFKWEEIAKDFVKNIREIL